MVRVGPERTGAECGSISTTDINSGRTSFELTCNMRGRYISVELPLDNNPTSLTLCEVKAYVGKCDGKSEVMTCLNHCHSKIRPNS